MQNCRPKLVPIEGIHCPVACTSILCLDYVERAESCNGDQHQTCLGRDRGEEGLPHRVKFAFPLKPYNAGDGNGNYDDSEAKRE